METQSQSFTKKLLYFLFGLIAVSLVAYFIVLQRGQKSTEITSQEQPLPTSNTEQMESVTIDLNVTPERPNGRVGEEIIYNVTVDTGSVGISAIDATIAFDPTILSVVSITPGEFLDNPQPLTEQIDPNNGQVRYALGALSYATGEGTLFSITVKLNQTTSKSMPLLVFDQKTTGAGLRDAQKQKTYSQEEITIIFNEGPFEVLP